MRKIIQIAMSGPSADYARQVLALCDDGSVWSLDLDFQEWSRVSDIPQDAPPPQPTQDVEPQESDGPRDWRSKTGLC